MKIAIVGAGNIGANLTRGLTRAGHQVTVANSRGPETLADLATETGATASQVPDVVAGAEVVVVTIPLVAVADLPGDLLASAAPGFVVIDTNNYYPQQRDGRIEAIEQGTTESRWVEQQLGHAVVKVFNGIYADHLVSASRPVGDPERRGLPVAADDPAAKQVVTRLVEDLGFDAVDAGGIDESWRQQPGTPSYGLSADAAGIRAALAEATPGRPADFTA